MKTNVNRLLMAGPILAVILIAFNAFKPAASGNHYANGGGIADGVHFNFNAVQQKDKPDPVGHLQWGGNFYRVECIIWSSSSSAILFTDAGWAFQVTDNGEGSSSSPDSISDPLAYFNDCGIGETLVFSSNNVTSGNIQVK
jgi:hypothetical protein